MMVHIIWNIELCLVSVTEVHSEAEMLIASFGTFFMEKIVLRLA